MGEKTKGKGGKKNENKNPSRCLVCSHSNLPGLSKLNSTGRLMLANASQYTIAIVLV